MYQIIIKREALKELHHLPKHVSSDIGKEIEQLGNVPRPHNCKKLKGGNEDLWRVRVRKYRIIYAINDTIRIINIRKIGHRKGVYE